MGRRSSLALVLGLSAGCTAIEEASLGELTPDAGAGFADVGASEPLDEADPSAPRDAAMPALDATSAEPAAPTSVAEAATASGESDANAARDALADPVQAHDAGSDASDAAHDASREDARRSLECRLEPWECR